MEINIQIILPDANKKFRVINDLLPPATIFFILAVQSLNKLVFETTLE